MEHLAKAVSEMDVRLRAVCTVDYGAAAAYGLHKILGSIQNFSPSKLMRRGVTSAEAVVVIL